MLIRRGIPFSNVVSRFSLSNFRCVSSGKILSGESNFTNHRDSRKKYSASSKKRKNFELPQSLDIHEKEQLIDVESYFPDAVRHLRKPPSEPSAAMERLTRKWHTEVHHLNVDGVPSPATEKTDDGKRSFFDQDRFDIRPTTGSSSQPHRKIAAGKAEMDSPDLLCVTGGNAQEHGLGVTEKSNSAPADATIEDDSPSEQYGVYGDTPVELTDMLKERLMELKTQKLQEDLYTSYLPKRLRLASDEEVALARMNPVKKQENEPKVSLASLTDDNERSVSLSEWNSNLSEEVREKANDFLLHDAYPSSHQRIREINPHIGGSSSGGQKDGVYLLRTLPRAGFCSRREAEFIISTGKVRVNNVVERNAFRLVQASDDIHIEGHKERLRFAPPRLWMYHKPAHIIVSRHDVAGRALFTKHAAILGIDHLIPVGTLPMRAHGVLLLTNDGELSSFLENPNSMIQQTYLLRVRPAIDAILAHRFNTKGIAINGKQFRGVEFLVNPAMKSRFSVKVKTRGANIRIHELMQHIGRTIERGGRIAVGPFALGNLAVGSIREVTVPPHYTEHTGAVWKAFVERDWPYFRKRRIIQLRKLSRYRELTPRELQELENAAYTEIQESIALETSELGSMAPEFSVRSRSSDTPFVASPFSSHNDSPSVMRDDIILDITNVDA